MLRSQIIQCPYCGERLEITLDLSAGSQDYVEDCQVCCRPMEIRLDVDELSGRFAAAAARDDD